MALAESIGSDLLTDAIADGTGLTWGRGAGRNNAPTPDSGPFNGRSGEAFLFAALYRATEKPHWASAARGALDAVYRGLSNDPEYPRALANRINFGLSGLGGVIYVLVRMAQFLDDPVWLALAHRAAEVIDAERVEEDGLYDVIWGSAGALLGLLALARASGGELREQTLERAQRCARHLIDHRIADPETGLRAWGILSSEPSASFAHGASGMAHALLSLHRSTPDPQLYAAAREAFAFERTLYDEARGNWRDTRAPDDTLPNMWSWCHGAPGIALARLAWLDSVVDEDQHRLAGDLKLALRATAMARIPGVDQICCGVWGRIDILLEAGRRIDNPSLVRQARKLAQQRLERIDERGLTLNPIDDVEAHKTPGFWQGVGGTAYALLRLAQPDRFPCVLAMD